MKHQIFLPKTTCDVLKLLAALLVVSSHMASTAIGPYHSGNPVFYATATQNGYLGVAVFFFLSGFGLMESELKAHLGLKTFFKKRYLKIFVPVLLVTALWIPAFYHITPPKNLWQSVCYDLFFGFADPVMWYVRVLFVLYAVFFLSTLLMNAGHRTLAVWLLFGVLMLFPLVNMAADDSIQRHSVPMFALGVIAAYYKKKGVGPFVWLTLATGLLLGVATYLMTSHPLTGLVHVVFDYVAISLMVAFVSVRRIEWRIPLVLASITFDIYLIHFKVIVVVSLFASLAWFLLLTPLVTFILSYAFMRLRKPIERRIATV